MNELKSCPFCGKKFNEGHYENCYFRVRGKGDEERESAWQSRPLEDALLARAEKAEAQLLREHAEKAEAQLKQEREQKQEYAELKQEYAELKQEYAELKQGWQQRQEHAESMVSELDAKTDKDVQELEALEYLRNRFGKTNSKGDDK